jgi:hypothetical protein
MMLHGKYIMFRLLERKGPDEPSDEEGRGGTDLYQCPI